MLIAAMYSHKYGLERMQENYGQHLAQIEEIIKSVDGEVHRTKVSQEKTMKERVLYSPTSMNQAIKEAFAQRGWQNHKEYCDYSTQYYVPGYRPRVTPKRAFRDMDFVKDRVGVEVQFGKYAFAIYNVCAKMTIFHKLGVIDIGVEIVPVRDLVDEMSTGITYFEQFVWDLEQRGASDIDLPVLILGIASVNNPETTPSEHVTLPDPQNEAENNSPIE